MDHSSETPSHGPESTSERQEKTPSPRETPVKSILTRTGTRRGFLKGVLALGTTELLAGDSSPQPTEKKPAEQSFKPEFTNERLPYEPTKEELAAVEAIFDKPGRPRSQFHSSEAIEQELTRAFLKAAKNNGLTLYDWNAEFSDLRADANRQGGSEIPFATYLERTQAFLKKYGVEISLGTDNRPNTYMYDGAPIDPSLLEQDSVKQSLLSLIQELGPMPVEMVQEMGLKHLTIIKIGYAKADGFADTEKTGNTFFFDPTKFEGGKFFHEMYHLYDVNHADQRTMHHDQAFQSLMPEQGLYDQDAVKSPHRDRYISYEKYLARSFPTQIFEARASNDSQRAGQLQQEADEQAANVVVASDYAFTNAVEDKAELGTRIMDPFLVSGILGRKAHIMRQKAVFLLARLYHDNPAFVQFLADASERG